MTAPGAPGTASDGYRTGPAPHTCRTGPTEPGIAPCDCRVWNPFTRRYVPRSATSLRPVDSGGRRRDTTNEGATP